MLQCPVSGSFHFYTVPEHDHRYGTEEFQCPTSGSFHFYMPRVLRPWQEDLVSMPYIGLIPFLRIPSHTSIKSAFPDTSLGGISQNILKIKDYPPKNGMFTICS